MLYYTVDKNYEYSDKFENKNDLLYAVKRGWSEYYLETYRDGIDDLYSRNSYLHNFGHSFGEYKVEWDRYFDPGSESFYHKRRKVWVKEIIIDELGRTVNLRDLADEAWDSNPTSPYIRRTWWNRRVDLRRVIRWDLYLKRCKHAGYGKCKGYYKGLQRERRLGCDPMHKPFVKGIRNYHALDPWNMRRRGRRIQITWKQVKVRKQWMAKQKALTIKDG